MLDSRLMSYGFESQCGQYIVSLSKTLYPLRSTGSAQEDPSQHDSKSVDWDVKNQIKQTKKSTNFTAVVKEDCI